MLYEVIPGAMADRRLGYLYEDAGRWAEAAAAHAAAAPRAPQPQREGGRSQVAEQRGDIRAETEEIVVRRVV